MAKKTPRQTVLYHQAKGFVLLNHYINDFTLNIDFLDHSLAFHEGLNGRNLLCLLKSRLLILVNRDGYGTSYLTVNLYADFNGVFFDCRFVVGGSGLECDGVLVSESLPHFFAYVRCDAGKHLDEAFLVAYGALACFVSGIDEDHHLSDGSVKAKALKV